MDKYAAQAAQLFPIANNQEFEIVVVRPHFAAAKGVDCDATVLIDGHRIGGIAFAATYFSDTAKKGHKYEKHNGAVYQKSLKFSELVCC
jgi:hypothetical protein